MGGLWLEWDVAAGEQYGIACLRVGWIRLVDVVHGVQVVCKGESCVLYVVVGHRCAHGI